MAAPVDDAYAGPSAGILAAGRFVAPEWSPSAGQIVSISKAAEFIGSAVVLEPLSCFINVTMDDALFSGSAVGLYTFSPLPLRKRTTNTQAVSRKPRLSTTRTARLG